MVLDPEVQNLTNYAFLELIRRLFKPDHYIIIVFKRFNREFSQSGYTPKYVKYKGLYKSMPYR